ncbi:sperm-associated antigen 7-like [Topomyia yanbarensis]|uniref:sperm-associated antigen 7-like n=1 Tax=Topomyia yanbarensis TaxID=2498891 RepID=UPI00273CB738|nr:sperm-associated antigen 7-like [Topomyia yanbarensis]XP_058831018.1 sperm-associated antigen 7-like [Topomyia yanbarensis]
MDLLDSILGSMDKPPSRDKKEKEMIEKQKKELEMLRNKERDELNRFRKFVEDRLGRLVKDSNRHYMDFQPLDKVHRSVVHDIAEVGGLVAMSFGVDGVDRYIVVYKKEHLPSEDELAARRNGDPWNKQTAMEYAEKRKQQRLLANEEQKELSHKKEMTVVPTSNYQDKYVHLIGQESALGAAKKTESNKTYGYVPSENKRDIRSIEQTMADIQAKKKLKAQHSSSIDSGQTGTFE